MSNIDITACGVCDGCRVWASLSEMVARFDAQVFGPKLRGIADRYKYSDEFDRRRLKAERDALLETRGDIVQAMIKEAGYPGVLSVQDPNPGQGWGMIEYVPDPTTEWSYMFDESHSCGWTYVGACRGCAQARVQHDSGDEDAGQWAGAKGLWLVGGGRYSMGISEGCAVAGLLSDGRPVGADRWNKVQAPKMTR